MAVDISDAIAAPAERFRRPTIANLLTDVKNLLLWRVTPARIWRSYQPSTDGLHVTVIRAADGARVGVGDDETPL